MNVATIAWEYGQASDEAVAERIDRQLMLLDSAQEAVSAVPWSKLMPLLRTTTLATASQLRGHAVTQPIDDYLCIILGLDHADGIQLVAPGDLSKWDRSSDELFNEAFANLHRQANPRSFEFSDFDGGRELALLRGVAPYGYQTSLAFCTALVRQLGSGRDGAPPVVFIPTRNDLAVVPSDRPDLLAAAYDEALALYQQHPRPLSPMAYSYDDRGLLTAWDAPEVLRDRQLRARAHHVHGEYEAHRGYFDRHPAGIAERDRGDLVLTPVQARVTGETWSIMSEVHEDEGKQFLPPARVDYVGIQIDDPISAPLLVRSRDYEQICGPLEYYPDLLPPRWQTSFPDGDQWLALERHRVSLQWA